MPRPTWIQRITGEPERTKIDTLLMDGIFPVLRERPGTTWREVAERVSKVLGQQYTASDCAAAASYGRRHREEYRWMVAPVGRGREVPGRDKGRIRVVMLEYASDEEKLTPVATEQIQRGFFAQMRTATTQANNAAAATTAAAQFEPRRGVRQKMLDFAEDAAYIAKKGAQLLRAVNGDE